MYFVARLVPALPMGGSLIWPLCPFDSPQQCGLLLLVFWDGFLISWHLRCPRLLWCIFRSSPRISHPTKEPRKDGHRNRGVGAPVLVATGVYLLPGPLSWADSKEMYVSISLCPIWICIKLTMSSHWRPSPNPLLHGYLWFSSLAFL